MYPDCARIHLTCAREAIEGWKKKIQEERNMRTESFEIIQRLALVGPQTRFTSRANEHKVSGCECTKGEGTKPSQ